MIHAVHVNPYANGVKRVALLNETGAKLDLRFFLPGPYGHEQLSLANIPKGRF